MAIENDTKHPYVDAADFAWIGIAILIAMIVVISLYVYFL